MLLQICKRITFRLLRGYRRACFRLFHTNCTKHDIICQGKDISIELSSDSVLAEPLFVGRFEEDESEFLRSIAESGMKVIDVGANVGIYTVLLGKAIRPFGHIWSFEPYQPVASYLKRNIEMNELDNVTVIEKAVAEKEGVLDFHIFSDGDDVYNSLGAAERPEEQLYAVRKIPVSVTTLDTVADETGIEKIDILKIDVEGAEEWVLKGAERLIRRSPNLQIVMELYEPSVQQCGCSIKRLIELLGSWGFSMFEIGPGGVMKCCTVEDFSGVNALFKRK